MTITNVSDLLANVGKPDIVLMCGLPGSGKSYIAEVLAKHLHARVLRSDDFRKQLFGEERFHSNVTDAEMRQHRAQAYDAMYAEALAEVRAGRAVVVDATHLTAGRSVFIRSVQAVTDRCVIVTVNTPEEVSLDRFKQEGRDADFIAQWQRVRAGMQHSLSLGEFNWPTAESDGVPVFSFVNH